MNISLYGQIVRSFEVLLSEGESTMLRRSEPQRAYFVIDSLEPYGTQRVLVELAKAALTEGWEACVICLKPIEADSISLPDSLSLVSLKRQQRSFVNLLYVIWSLRRFLARRRGLVISFLPLANVVSSVACLGLRGVKLIVSEHGDPDRSRRFANFLRFVCHITYRFAKTRVAVSSSLARNASSYLRLKPNAFTVIENPINSADILSLASSSALPHPWLAEDRPCRVLVQVARLERYKGQELLLRAMCRPDLSEMRALLLGGGSDREFLKKLIDDLSLSGRVELVGRVENPYPWIKCADALVITSQREGFGLVALEAGILGTAVIATPVGPLPEFVGSVVTGRVTQSFNVDDVVTAIKAQLEPEQADIHVATEALNSLFNPVVVWRKYVLAA